MPRLIWVFAGHTDNFVGFVMRQLIWLWKPLEIVPLFWFFFTLPKYKNNYFYPFSKIHVCIWLIMRRVSVLLCIIEFYLYFMGRRPELLNKCIVISFSCSCSYSILVYFCKLAFCTFYAIFWLVFDARSASVTQKYQTGLEKQCRYRSDCSFGSTLFATSSASFGCISV